MAVQSYQLFVNTIRWSLENLKNWWISKKTKEFEEILPTFCHGTKVKPCKIWKKEIYKLIVRLTGRKEEKSCFCKEIGATSKKLKFCKKNRIFGNESQCPIWPKIEILQEKLNFWRKKKFLKKIPKKFSKKNFFSSSKKGLKSWENA